MENYLTPNDPDAFLGWEKISRPKYLPNECPKCHGHGGWNLHIDAYGPGRHFKACCDNCNGYGYVSDDSHIHDWHSTQMSMHIRKEVCNICRKEQIVDSSG